jgi:hypothetical protein
VAAGRAKSRSFLVVNEHFPPTDNKVDGAAERLIIYYKSALYKTQVHTKLLRKIKVVLFVFILFGLCNAYIPELLNYRAQVDFFQDYAAGYLLYKGESIYSTASFIEVLKKEYSINYLSTNFHPPFTAFLILPLLLVTKESAAILFSLLLFFAAFFFIFINIQNIKSRYISSWQTATFLTISLFFWYPVYYGIIIGNNNHVVCLLLGIFQYLYTQKKQSSNNVLLGSIALAISILLKIYPILMTVALLARKDIAFLRYTFLAVVTLSCLSLCIISIHDYTIFFTHVIENNVNIYKLYPRNVSLNGLIAPLMINNTFIASFTRNTNIYHFLTLTCYAVISLLYLCNIYTKSEDKMYIVSLTFITMLLLSPTTWDNNLLLALPAYIYIFNQNVSKIFLYCLSIGLMITPQISEILILALGFPFKLGLGGYLLLKLSGFTVLFMFFYMTCRNSGKSTA